MTGPKEPAERRTLGGRYEVGGLLGSGGMAEVHSGRDVRLGRRVAIKILRPDLARDPSFLTRFRREAQASASLNHPSIVAVYDTGEDPTGPTPYIVMEFVEGRTLRDLMRAEGLLEQRRAAEITSEICAALDFSHRNGIVHRDVKPGNVMITDTGAVKVMDFGIARAMTDSAATITSTAQVIGTAQYLSPEQARGESVDARSDVYSTGCLLYELLVGEPPYTGDSPVAIAYQHVREQPIPPSERNPEIPESMDRIVLRAMAKAPDQRYQSAAEMRADLQRAIAGQPVEAAPVAVAEARTSIVSTVPAAAAGAAVAGTTYDTDADRRKRQRAVGFALLAIGVIALFIAAAIFGPRLFKENHKAGGVAPSSSTSSPTPTTPSPTPTTPPSTTPPSTTPPSTTPPSTTPTKTTQKVPLVRVPDLSGKTPDEAKTALRHVGLKLNPDVRNQPSDEGSKGKVVGQKPPFGQRIRKDAQVSIFVGGGPAKVTVPLVNGLSLEDAQRALINAGLKADPNTFAKRSTTAAGTVLNSQPAQNTLVDKGSSVVLVVSTGTVPVPDVHGMSEEQARAKLNESGFYNIDAPTKQSSEAVGTVIDENPRAGVDAAPTRHITITIAEAPPTTTPPPTSSAPPPTTTPPPTSSAQPTSSAPPSRASSPSTPTSSPKNSKSHGKGNGNGKSKGNGKNNQ